MSGKHDFRRDHPEFHRALQVGEFAVRGRQAGSTSRIVEFPKEIQGFWETVQRSRPEPWTARVGNGGVAVFLMFSKGWRLFFRRPGRAA